MLVKKFRWGYKMKNANKLVLLFITSFLLFALANVAKAGPKYYTETYLSDSVLGMKYMPAASSVTLKSGYGKIYPKDDDIVYFLDDDGIEYNLLMGGVADLDALSDVILGTSATGEHLVFDGSFWRNASPTTVINGDASESHILSYAATGVGVSWVDLAGTHTLQIPNASESDVTAGLLSKQAYDLFNTPMTYSATGTEVAWATRELQIPYASEAGVEAGLISKSQFDSFNNKPSTLASQSDVLINTATHGDVLTYDKSIGYWVNTAETIASHDSLSGLNAGDYQHLTAPQATIAAQPASDTVGGYVSTQAQVFSGAKTFPTLNATDLTLGSALVIAQQTTTPANPAAGFNKIYPKADDKIYKLTSGGVESELGSSGTAGLDPNTLELFVADDSVTGDINYLATGATFGSLVGTPVNLPTVSTDDFLSSNSFKYSTVANGINDIFGYSSTLSPGQTGKKYYMTTRYQTSGIATDTELSYGIQYDSASPEIIKLSVATDGNGFALVGIHVPYNASGSTIRAGFRNATGTLGMDLWWDNFTITTRPVNPLQYIEYYGPAGYGSTNNKIPYFLTLVKNEGDKILEVSNSARWGISFTALMRCRITVYYKTNRTDSYIGASIDASGTYLTTSITDIYDSKEAVGQNYLAGHSRVFETTQVLNPGQVFRPHTQGTPYFYTKLVITAEGI